MALIKREYTDNETVITAENMNAIQDAIIDLEDGLFTVDDDRRGNIISISDAAKRSFRSFNIYGKTTQNGVPAAGSPVTLDSPGSNGSLSVAVCEKNLWNHENDMANMASLSNWGSPIWRNATVITTLKPNTTYTMKCKVTCLSVPDYSSVFSDQCGLILHSGSGKLVYMATSLGDGALVAGEQRTIQGTFTTPADVQDVSAGYRILYYTQRFLMADGTATYATVRLDDVQLEAGDTASGYVPYKGQKISISTPNGIHGLPVTYGGNYTGDDGKQWLCDEIDLAKGAYISMVKKTVLRADAYTWYIGADSQQTANTTLFFCYVNDKKQGASNFMCDRFQVRNVIGAANDFNGICGSTNTIIYVRLDGVYTLDGFKAWLETNPVTIVYELATAIETPLSGEEQAAYAALHTYKDFTTVSNDGLAYMELEYVMDAKKYIDSRVTGGIVPATVE